MTKLFPSGVIAPANMMVMKPSYSAQVKKTVVLPEPKDGVAQDLAIQYDISVELNYDATHFGAAAFKEPVALGGNTVSYEPIVIRLDKTPDYPGMQKKNDAEMTKRIKRVAGRQREIAENRAALASQPDTEHAKIYQTISEKEGQLQVHIAALNEMVKAQADLEGGTQEELFEWIDKLLGDSPETEKLKAAVSTLSEEFYDGCFLNHDNNNLQVDRAA